MDERYRRTYKTLYSLIVEPPPEPVVVEEWFGPMEQPPGPLYGQIVAGAIDDAERRRRDGARLREDAKALLALNFVNLVLLPLAAGGEDIGLVQQYVRDDTAMLVAESEVDRTTRVPEVTGHAVIDALSQNWRGLRISRFRLWERSNE
jgi:hypothetical protein